MSEPTWMTRTKTYGLVQHSFGKFDKSERIRFVDEERLDLQGCRVTYQVLVPPDENADEYTVEVDGEEF